MRVLILSIFLFVKMPLFSQDTTVTWIRNIDTSSYKISYRKSNIPKEFYKFIGINRKNEIVNPSKNWTPSCISRKHYRLNWIAKDKNNHWVISVTYGGRGVFTTYQYFDKVNDKLNLNELDFGRGNFQFSQTVKYIKSGDFEFEEIDLSDYEEEIE